MRERRANKSFASTSDIRETSNDLLYMLSCLLRVVMMIFPCEHAGIYCRRFRVASSALSRIRSQRSRVRTSQLMVSCAFSPSFFSTDMLARSTSRVATELASTYRTSENLKEGLKGET